MKVHFFRIGENSHFGSYYIGKFYRLILQVFSNYTNAIKMVTIKLDVNTLVMYKFLIETVIVEKELVELSVEISLTLKIKMIIFL